MAAPIRNPFYVLLILASGALLLTMFIYLLGWYYVPNPDQPAMNLPPMPPWVKWIDRHAMWLITAEVATILVLSALTIGLDRFFEPDQPAGSGTDQPASSGTGAAETPAEVKSHSIPGSSSESRLAENAAAGDDSEAPQPTSRVEEKS